MTSGGGGQDDPDEAEMERARAAVHDANAALQQASGGIDGDGEESDDLASQSISLGDDEDDDDEEDEEDDEDDEELGGMWVEVLAPQPGDEDMSDEDGEGLTDDDEFDDDYESYSDSDSEVGAVRKLNPVEPIA
jgi:hypothetical protein